MKKMTFGASVKATGTLTFTGTDVVGFLITIGGKGLQEGVDWTADGTVALDAAAIAAAINTNTATCLATATAVGATVTITANTAGTAGNSIVITVSTGGQTTQSAATLLGGLAQTGAVAFTGPGHVKTITVKGTGSALGVQVLNGLTLSGTEYDLVTGTTGQSVVRTYRKGLMLPTGCFLLPGADITAVYIEYETI